MTVCVEISSTRSTKRCLSDENLREVAVLGYCPSDVKAEENAKTINWLSGDKPSKPDFLYFRGN